MRKRWWISFNFNSWKPVAKMSYKKKINQFAAYIRKKYGGAVVIAIQEFVTGGGKYIGELYEAFGREYYIIVPPSFDYRTHARSLVTITLLKKSAVERYEVKDLGKCLPNRVSYVVAWIDGESWSILNIYAVQTANFSGKADWYITQRKELHEALWGEILAEAKSQSEGRVIILGDFQESSEGSHIKELNSMGYKETALGFPAVRNEFFKEWNIDHIFFSKMTWDELNPLEFALDGDLVDELSDHCLLAAMSA